MIRGALLGAAALLIAAPVLATPALAPVWSDHAVIQRDRPVVVEGRAAPGEKVSGVLGSATASAAAAKDGSFRLTFPARPASSDPVMLIVTGADGTSTSISDLLVGDVWLCGGQSNMEFSVGASARGEAAVQNAKDDGLRLLMIPKATALTPQASFGDAAKWAAASPDTVPTFSGACYYMARQLRQDLKIPIGAIHSNWGGSQIRAWVTPEGGRALYGDAAMALEQRFATDPLGAVTAFAPTWEEWWRSGTGGQEPWTNPDVLTGWQPVPSIGPYPSWTGNPLATDTIGNVWFRRTLTLTAAQAAKGGMLSVGKIDDMDTTWVNGKIVGNTFSWDNERQYPVPSAYLHAGDNEIVLAISNSWGSGGFASGADRLFFKLDGGETIPLGEGWRYAVGRIKEMPPRAPWDANAGIGVMYNTMIAPFGHFALAGAAWYQGESDVGIPGYADRLKQLFAGWRRQFGQDIRMLVVQLPNFGPIAEKPGPSGWAEIRNEEFKAVAADRNAALIPTFDIGERNNLHPLDKLDVGLRLAMAAEGKRLPLPVSAKRERGGIVIDFSGVEGGLRTWSGAHPLGLELCDWTQESCRYVEGTITGGALRIPDDGKPASRVRYAWAESPVVNLYDGRALPVPGFELPIIPVTISLGEGGLSRR